MAAAIPLAVGLAVGGGTYLALAGTANALMWAMTAGMIAMTIAQMLMAPEVKSTASTTDYALKEYTARSDNVALPRVYGTVGVPANLVWYGNYFWQQTRASQSESRVY